MGTVTTPPADEARSIFDDLGYSVTGAGSEFRAIRDWKEIHVLAVDGDVDAPDDGSYRCFVTWEEGVPALERRLERADPSYEWAVIGVADDGDYEVARAPPS
jgi:hypothetical protein